MDDPPDNRSLEKWMREALAEARKGLGLTAPNPPVGAVIVRDGEIIGRGWHQGAGHPHAEPNALADAAARHGLDALRGATAVITLEPCSTHGRTPPCVDALLEAGIREVVWGADDPSPAHAGRAAALLEAAGITVHRHILEEECRQMIAGFSSALARSRPWMIAKWAMSLDGRLTRPPGEGPWLSSPESLADVQNFRSECDAILTSAATIARDNPHLTLRHPHPHAPPHLPKAPLRRIIVSRGHTPLPADARVFTDEHASRTLVARLGNGPAIPVPSPVTSLAFPDWPSLLQHLADELDIHRLCVESGGRLMGSLLDQGLLDEARIYLCPLVCGGGVPATGGLGFPTPALSPRISPFHVTPLGPDLRIDGPIQPSPKAPPPPPPTLRPAIFFDRDGVVNDPGPHYYVTRWEDFRFQPGIETLLRRCRDRGYALVLVTSQRGVGKKQMSAAALDHIHAQMQEHLAKHGVAFERIDAYTSAEADGPGAKPSPQMILHAADALHLDLASSWVIGDSPRDIEMGHRAGCRTLKIGTPLPDKHPPANLFAPDLAAIPATWPPR